MPSPKIIRSGLEELHKLILNARGAYGAQRLERAADEIPNLENQYSIPALQKTFTGDNAGSVMTLDPADFQKYSTPMPASNTISNGLRYPENQMEAPGGQNYMTLPEIARLKGFSDVPYFSFNQQDNAMPFITGHEGRHRSAALESLGDKKTLVRMEPNWDFREDMPRRSQEEYIDALRTKFLPHDSIMPELRNTSSPQRPPMPLPKQFKKGGLVGT